MLGGYLNPLFHRDCKVSLFTSLKRMLFFGASCMIGPACIDLVESPYTAIALLCVGGYRAGVVGEYLGKPRST